jgi:Ca2+-binding RTX toxin-like protein
MMTVSFIKADLEFILQQTKIAESHAAGAPLASLISNGELPFGLRTVDGLYNNIVPERSEFGAADVLFPRMTTPVFRNAENVTIDLDGPGPLQVGDPTSYTQTSGFVFDSEPRTISNLIVDDTANNPAAVAAAAGTPGSDLVTATRIDGSPFDTFFIPNVSPDEGLSAPFNAWMTFFGQFFDHGLDLVNKGGNGTVFIPLQPDDPLFVPGSPTNFMVLTRATMLPGPDGVLGTEDDVHENTNQTTPFVDQNQTYTSHPSHQVFVRAYEFNAAGDPVATGKLIVNRNLGADGEFGTPDDVVIGGMATWAVVKAQARDVLGIQLTDADVFDVPLLATDPYGKFIPGPNGFPQLVTQSGLVEGNPAANGGSGMAIPADAFRTGHAFLNDIAHTAAPNAGLTPDPDADVGNVPPAGTYDNELLDAHYIAGDGRVNENIGLTTVHHMFHSEHNRLADHVKDVILQSGDVAFLNQWLVNPVAAIPANPATLVWNGERVFQAAKFGTEMQYQHLVFEEFARTVQPLVDAFIDFDNTINPAIVAEFAHTVYRFGHSMLLETIDRLDPNFVSSEIGLIQAFLNPLEFAASGPTPEQAAGAIVRGLTRQVGNEIDEFVTEALRNNLVGLPLDLAAINLARGRDTGVPPLNAARREFFAGTGDTQLTPYTSWTDFAQHLKHPESLINFIAAYGTHPTVRDSGLDGILGNADDVTTLAAKRAAATAIVLGGVGAPADAVAFLNSTGDWASGPDGVTITGLDAVDFWVGGLAEAKMPFGGMLGSTFNFVFETQLESLQNGDRFYYLHRLQGQHFLSELENNTFSSLIAINTDVTHLPALSFSAVGLTLEVNPLRQFNAGLGSADPISENPLIPAVIRDNPATPGPDTNYLQYTGPEHVVLGGTAGNDILIASEGDDTLYGDAGNERLEGGYGNDQIFGGPGDDIITDAGGDDVIHGEEGNDVIHAGATVAGGFNLILGGPGSDFIVTGEDFSDIFAGPGNDFILGARLDAFPNGNEGDDWLERGLQDGAAGDNFDPFGLDPVAGNDVFLGDGGFDETIGEGGDDITVGSEGGDRYSGGSGFDWVTYKDDRFGVMADFFRGAVRATGAVAPQIPGSVAGLAVYLQMEGLSGSAHDDILRGDDAIEAQIRLAGAKGSVLTNFDLITGLRDFVGSAAAGPDGIVGTADDEFAAGNILLGGAGSDIIEGRAGDDLIDGDLWLNVRISVRDAVRDANGDFVRDAQGDLILLNAELATYDSMIPLVPLMLNGTYNPGQLVIVRELLPGAAGFDTAVFSGNRADYSVITGANGVTTVTHVGTIPGLPGGALSDGTDRLTNIERLQFNDQVLVLVPGLNQEPTGALAVSDLTPAVGQTLTVSLGNVADLDGITGRVNYMWQQETVPGSGIFRDYTGPLGLLPIAFGDTFTVGADLAGFALRVKAHYVDGNGVQESVFSLPTAAVAPGAPAPAPAPLLNGPQTGIVSPGVHFLGSDLQFILTQIKLAERHSAGEDPITLVDNLRSSLGLRTVDGSFNNLVQAQSGFGASDEVFPRLTTPVFRDAEAGSSYDQKNGLVTDSQPRTISNLIVDDTDNNPAAVAAAGQTPGAGLVTATRTDGTPFETFFIPNQAPDGGLSAPFNAWMTFFGQFFDHGLDLVNKGGNGTVFMPLAPDDPLFVPGSPTNFMVLTRATMLPGADGVLGTDDDIHENVNQTTPFVDQNQTYASHPSHQAFLRAYEFNAAGAPVATGKLIVNRDLGPDGIFGTADDVVIGGMATWAVVKAQARALLGIDLTDANVFDVPLLATDPYGNFIPGPNGFVQVVMKGPDGIAGTVDDFLAEGNPDAPIDLTNSVGTNHQFLNDIAHSANPSAAPGLVRDNNGVIGGLQPLGTYDGELLDAHYIAGDGRVNENIGLTTVHHIFHSEHNRLVDHVKDVVLDTAEGGDVSFLNEWLLTPVLGVPANLSTLVWNGERLFQAAKFGTEMEYQHLVFEEFARTIQPNIDPFIPQNQNYQSEINPAIVAEFAHTVYRFGHSMLTETIDRLDPNFVSSEIGLIQAFLNPLAFAESGPTPEAAAGAIIRGVTRQIGNEIDEFVTEALRNNLVGLPLDLASINLARGRDTGVPPLNAARRDFWTDTGDSNLAPYTSWADFVQHIKHPESLTNFIAAYGTHPTITAATTLAGKRAAASLIVLGGAGEPADRLDFLYSAGDWAPDAGTHPKDADGVTTTGLGSVDFWVGGLAEKITPFGGMLGSSFNFVFENQLEKLQNADRFYYLNRTADLNFLTELENNSFAKLIMANTDATHLPGLVFQVNLILEVDQARQFNELVIPGPDGILGTFDDLPGSADPVGDNSLIPLVIRNNPATPGPDTNYLQYTGPDHVVLGGTAGNDILVGSIGDDSIYGDEGNDRIEGGDGNDFLRGGPGDDIITDTGGDDVLQGDDGNDVLHGGNGINLILGGFGKDFIIIGEDGGEAFGGPGDDLILGGNGTEQSMGNEGDDWIEAGLLDGAPGDNFNNRFLDDVAGNDVFIGTGGPDIMFGEGGDDIFVGSSSAVNFNGDRYLGMSGFDWATFKDEPAGVGIDLTLSAVNPVPDPVALAVVARFDAVEGLSGSRFSDFLRGDNADAAQIAVAGMRGSVLTNFDLISGLRAFVGAAGFGPDGIGGTADDRFGEGNIILGGDGSDLIQGDSSLRIGVGALGGNDLIDGDKWLNVRISVRQNADGTGPEIATFDSMVPMVPFMLDGTYNPGQLVIVREILPGSGGFNIDTALYSGNRANYTIVVDNNGTPGNPADDIITVTGIAADGVDRLTNIERLRFADMTVVLNPALNALNAPATGLLTISDPTPTAGQILTVSAAGISDPQGLGPITYIWQFEAVPGTGIFQDVLLGAGAAFVPAIGPSLTVPTNLVGLALRVQGVFQDGAGVMEVVGSAPTDLVAVDVTRPTVTINQAAGQADPTNATTIRFTAVFSEPVFGFGDVPADVVLTGTAGATSVAISTTDNITFEVLVGGMASNGTVTVSIPAGAATDLAGNPSTVSTSTDNTVTYDITPPAVAINQSVSQVDPTTGANIRFTVVFSEPVTGFGDLATDVTLGGTSGATSVAISTTDNVTFDVAVTGMTNSGTVTASIPAGAVTDLAGNPNTASTSTDNTVTYVDIVGPAVTIDQAAGQIDPTNTSPITFTVTFSEPIVVGSFTAADVTLSGTAGATTASVSSTPDPLVYTVAVTGMTNDGTVIAGIPAGAAQDLSGNPNAASSSSDNTVTYDITAPTVTVSQAAGQADPTNVSPINFTVTFSEPIVVGSFTAADVTLSGTAGATTAAISSTPDPLVYHVAVSGMTSSGIVIASIPAGAVQDAAGNLNLISTSIDNTVTYDITAPTVTVNQAAGQTDPTGASLINFTVTFSELVVVGSFTAADVTLSGTAGATTAVISSTPDPLVYHVAVSGMTNSGIVIASIPAGAVQDAAGNLNLVSTSTDNTVNYLPPPVLDLHTFDSGNYLDDFNTPSFSNSQGTAAWTTSWAETGDSGGVTAGQIRIDGGAGAGTNQLRFLGGGGANGASIQRVADLSGATSATLSFNYAEIGFDANETVLVQFAADGVNFTTLQTINTASNTGTSNLALTGPFSANSTVRFVVSAVNLANESVQIDNVNIAFTTPVNDASNDFATTFTESGAAASIASGPRITDLDSTNLVSGKIVLTNAKPGDALSISGALPAGILSSIDPLAPGVITMNLTGTAALANYQAAIAAVRFANTSQAPDTAPRTIQVTVNDGTSDSNVATATVTVVAFNQPAVLGNDRLLINAQNTNFVIPEWVFLANDVDPDTLLDITAVSNPVGLGTLTLSPGFITVSDIGTANGSFTYTAGGATATVTVILDAAAMNGNNTAEIIVGSAAADLANGNGGNDIILAGDGNDAIVGGAGNDTLLGEAGNDTFNYAIGDGADAVDGGAQTTADVLSITAGVGAQTLDVIYNGISLTNFEGGTIVDVESVTANLGGGTDTLSYTGSIAPVAVNLGTGTASGFTTITAIENVTGGSGADTLTGSATANTLNGGDGGDILAGGGGADTINTGAADDNVPDRVRWSAITEFGDTVTNFDATGTVLQIDRVELTGALLGLLDDGTADGIVNWVTGDGVNNNNVAVDLNGAVEALFLGGANAEGVTAANLANATTVAAEFNAEFALTAANGESTLLVINDTNGNSASVWRWLQSANGGEIQANELTRIATINANGTVTTDSVGFDLGAPLLAASVRAPSGTSGGAPSPAALRSVVRAAIADLASQGLSPELVSKLEQVEFVVQDLPGSYLGMASGNTVYLDADAAGHGWFVDRTPSRAEEFHRTGLAGELRAVNPRAVDRIDLLTVVTHELGHLAGLAHSNAVTNDLMNSTLAAGTRHTASVDEALADEAFWNSFHR